MRVILRVAILIICCSYIMSCLPTDLVIGLVAHDAEKRTEEKAKTVGGLVYLLSDGEKYLLKDIDSFDTSNLQDLHKLSLVRIFLGHYDKALKLNKHALDISKKNFGEVSIEVFRCLLIRAEIFCFLKDYSTAIGLANKALNMKLRDRSTEISVAYKEISVAYKLLGLIYLKLKDYEKAKEYLANSASREAMVEYYLAIGNNDAALDFLKEAPSLSEDINKLIIYYTQRGLAFHALQKDDKAAKDLFLAVMFIESYIKYLPIDLRLGIFSGWYAGGNLRPYHTLINILVEAEQEPKKPLSSDGRSNLEIAFYLAEAIKGRGLYETLIIKKGKTLRESNLDSMEPPKELKEKEIIFKDKIESLKSKVNEYQEKGNPIPPEFIKERNELFLKFNEFEKELRINAPLYTLLSYPRPLYPNEIFIRDNEIILEYVFVGTSCYCFKLEKGAPIKLYRLPANRGEIEIIIEEFKDALRHTNKQTETVLLVNGKKLYDILIKSTSININSKKKIVIIPDGMLGLIPFQSIIVDKGNDIKDSIFITDKWQINYYQSATLMTLSRYLPVLKAQKPLLAIGNPIFIKGRRTLGDTEEEIKKIANLFSVKPEPPNILLGKYANKDELKRSKKSDYRYIHFATHGDIETEEPYLILSPGKDEKGGENLLRCSDVSEWELKANAVVLSACVTGEGKLKNGESIMNFARAFQLAGARSVIVSLWKVDNPTAVGLMVDMYKHLKNDLGSIESLRLASIMIKQSKPHPFYWAVFITYGED